MQTALPTKPCWQEALLGAGSAMKGTRLGSACCNIAVSPATSLCDPAMSLLQQKGPGWHSSEFPACLLPCAACPLPAQHFGWVLKPTLSVGLFGLYR